MEEGQMKKRKETEAKISNRNGKSKPKGKKKVWYKDCYHFLQKINNDAWMVDDEDLELMEEDILDSTKGKALTNWIKFNTCWRSWNFNKVFKITSAKFNVWKEELFGNEFKIWYTTSVEYLLGKIIWIVLCGFLLMAIFFWKRFHVYTNLHMTFWSQLQNQSAGFPKFRFSSHVK